MSLHHAAQHLAAQGRHGDDMLVHMNRKEVAGLQALAQQKGTHLTTNPHTGMPEAFGLGDLNPFRIVQGKGEIGESGLGSVLIGAALMAAGVPPMVFGAESALAGAAGAGLLTGGASALMGGGLKGALGSGLGAYGGASLYGAMNPATPATTAAPTGSPTAPTGGPVPAAPANAPVAQPVSTAPAPATPAYTPNPNPVVTTPPPGYFDDTMYASQNATTTAQADALKASMPPAAPATPTVPTQASFMDKAGQFVKDYKWPLGAAAVYGLTHETPKGVEPDTKTPPGKIRPYIYDPATQGLRQLRPYDAPGYAYGGDVQSDPNMQQIPSFDPVTRMADGGVTGNGSLNLNIPLNLGGQASGANGYQAAGSGGGSSFTGPSVSGGMLSQAGAGGYGPPMDQRMMQQSYGLDQRAIAANPQGFQNMMERAQLQERVYPGSTFLSQMGGAGMGAAMGAMRFADGGIAALGGYSDGGQLLRGPGDGVSDSIPATIGHKQPARLADGEFVVPARIVSELGNGSTEAGARKLYGMMDRIQKARGKTTGKNKVATNSRADKYLPA